MNEVREIVQVNSLFRAIRRGEAAVALMRSIDCAAVARIHGRITRVSTPDRFRSDRHADEDVCRWSGTARLRIGRGLRVIGCSDRGDVGRLPSALASHGKQNR